MGGWVAVELEQAGPNRDAVGAWVEVKARGRTNLKEVTVGGGHAGGQLGWIHFGLGDGRRAKVRVTWPDGDRGPWMDVRSGTFVTIVRDAPGAVRWTPET
jgi:hypothetical protein